MLHVFYGNLDFEEFMGDVPYMVVDLSKIKTSQEMVTAIKKPEIPAGMVNPIIIVKSAWRIKAFYEEYISRNIANSNQPIIVLGDGRFEYFRELKRALSIFMNSLKEVKHPVILTFPMEEKENNMVHRAYPSGYDDFSLYGQFFKSIVPFVVVDKQPVVLNTVPMLSKNVMYETFSEYIKDLHKSEVHDIPDRVYEARK